jgi:ATP-dependent helicase HrpA
MRISAVQKQGLLDAIAGCLCADRSRLSRRLSDLGRERDADKAMAQLEQLLAAVQTSQEKVGRRRERLPALNLNAELPVSQRAEDIIAAIHSHQVVVIAGETGSGKTTQLPKLAMAAGRGVHGIIGHTQPRRIAARTVAARIAEELQTPLGDKVGYKVRFTDESSPDGYIKLMTDGVLLAELTQDRYLNAYDTIIIDEAHERSLNIDFLLGYLKNLLPRRPDLKVLITSATIDVERFSKHFDNAPVILVEGRTYPVETLYRPIMSGEKGFIASDEDDAFADLEESIPRAVLEAVEECLEHERRTGRAGRGDILVFSSHEREIREIADLLRKYGPPHTEVLPLYARLSLNDQQKVFMPHSGRRIVIATNVAETSLTVPNIHYVIDPGFARISRYSYRSKVQRLPIEAIAQASANQRQGRCGRIAPGLCIRLYAEEDFLGRAEFTVPEIQRTNLAAVILQMQNLGLGEIEDFPFLDKPDSRFINDGFKLLEELGAVDKDRRLTPTGRQLGRFPLDPRIARMIIAAGQQGCLREMLMIASALSSQDPRERPQDKQQAADEKHAQFKNVDSDFIFYVNLWTTLEAQRGDMTESQRRQYARQNFLSYLRLREWRETHRQLLLIAQEFSLPFNAEPATYEALHKALLTGLLSQIAQKTEEREYLAARSQKVMIFPGSALAKKGPPWVLAAEMVETQRVYLRTVAKIEPEWVEQLAEPLLKRSYFEPHWEKRQGRVMAYEQVSLYGLILVPRRKIGYEAINAEESREIFIRRALVEGDVELRAPFFRHNQQLIQDVEVLENKARRRDILVDEETLFQFYEARVPAEVVGLKSFEAWRSRAEKTEPQLLFLTREQLLARDDDDTTDIDFPDWLLEGELKLPLEYHFEPGHKADGVTVIVPIGLLQELPEERLEWLVPGLLKGKVEALLKSLPKAQRRNLVPVPDTAARLLEQLQPGRATPGRATPGRASLLRGLEDLLRQRGLLLTAQDWDLAALPAHCRMNIRVLGMDRKVLAEGRDLAQLRLDLKQDAGQHLAQVGDGHALERQSLRAWDCGDIPEVVEIRRQGLGSKAYPGLLAGVEGVDLRLFATRREARQAHPQGLNQLYQITLSSDVKYLKRIVGEHKQLGLLYAPYGNRTELETAFVHAVVDHVMVESRPLVYTQQSFQEAVALGRPQLAAAGLRLLETVAAIYSGLSAVQKQLKTVANPVYREASDDIVRQIQGLGPGDFLYKVSFARWQHFPRYLKALEVRLGKLPNNLGRDSEASRELARLWQGYENRLRQLEAREQDTSLLEQFRWLLEEYRVSLFAQPMKTALPVSAARLAKLWADIPQ